MLENDLTLLSPDTRRALEHPPAVLIGGEWHAAGGALPTRDPSSGATVAEIAAGGSAEVDAAVRAARHAFEHGAWPRMRGAEREALLRRLADLMERDRQLLAELEVVDVGMPLWMASNLNVGGAIDVLRYMAGFASRISGRTVQAGVPIPGSAFFGYTQKEPLGVVGAIIPWNVPLMMSVWKLAPALAAGCTLVLKPSEEACLSVLHLARLVVEAGFPPGVVNVVTGTGVTAGAALTEHEGLDKITFTGSTVTGRLVAAAAVRHFTRTTLELGGKSPQLLFDDVDLDVAIPGIAGGIFLNSGQICVAGSRLYVQAGRFDEVVERLVRHADAMKIGPGLAPDTVMGPLINARQQHRVLQQIDDAAHAGAEVLSASARVEAPGFYVRPTVIAVKDQRAAIVQEEVFGPVITVSAFEDEEHAVQLANDTAFGLSANVWSNNLSVVHRVVPRIRSGKVAVNTEPVPWPGLPEGGRRASGYGRDLGEESFESFLETKSVLIRYA